MKLRPQFNLKFRSAEEFVAVKEKAQVEDISVNEWVLRGMESAAGWEPGKWDGKAEEAGTGKNFPNVARGAMVAQSIVDKDLVVARGQKSAVGAELNSADALAGLGISSPVAPVYGGIKRLPSTGPQCMFCGGLNGLHQKDCQREKGKKK